MSESYPISAQSGLSQDQLDAMEVSEQKLSTVQYKAMTAQSGVVLGQVTLASNIKGALVDYINAIKAMDQKDSAAMDTCVKNFSDSLAKIMVNALQAQAVTVETTVTATAATGLIQVQGSSSAQANVVPIVIPGTGSATASQVNIK